MFKFKSLAKVRISEDNTKQKGFFLFLLSSESTFDEVKVQNKSGLTKLSAHFLISKQFISV